MPWSSVGRSRTGSCPGRVTVVPLVEPRSRTSTCQPSSTTSAWLREMSRSGPPTRSRCGRWLAGSSSLTRGARPSSTPRSSGTLPPVEMRSTPSDGRGVGNGCCGGISRPQVRQVPACGGDGCPAGQSTASTTGRSRSSSVRGRAPRSVVTSGVACSMPMGRVRRRPAPRVARPRAARWVPTSAVGGAGRPRPVRPARPGRRLGGLDGDGALVEPSGRRHGTASISPLRGAGAAGPGRRAAARSDLVRGRQGEVGLRRGGHHRFRFGLGLGFRLGLWRASGAASVPTSGPGPTGSSPSLCSGSAGDCASAAAPTSWPGGPGGASPAVVLRFGRLEHHLAVLGDVHVEVEVEPRHPAAAPPPGAVGKHDDRGTAHDHPNPVGVGAHATKSGAADQAVRRQRLEQRDQARRAAAASSDSACRSAASTTASTSGPLTASQPWLHDGAHGAHGRLLGLVDGRGRGRRRPGRWRRDPGSAYLGTSSPGSAATRRAQVSSSPVRGAVSASPSSLVVVARADGHHDHRDVVAPAGPHRGGDQLVGGDLRVGVLAGDEHDLAVVELVGQPVAAHDEALTGRRRQHPHVRATARGPSRASG